eukprot:6738401-Prymnesium_polylepis.2
MGVRAPPAPPTARRCGHIARSLEASCPASDSTRVSKPTPAPLPTDCRLSRGVPDRPPPLLLPPLEVADALLSRSAASRACSEVAVSS